jgi:hypothetical protein
MLSFCDSTGIVNIMSSNLDVFKFRYVSEIQLRNTITELFDMRVCPCIVDILYVEKKKPTRCHLKTLLFLGTAQHVSGTHMPIIRSLSSSVRCVVPKMLVVS